MVIVIGDYNLHGYIKVLNIIYFFIPYSKNINKIYFLSYSKTENQNDRRIKCRISLYYT